mgnify:CR=1 FL=1
MRLVVSFALLLAATAASAQQPPVIGGGPIAGGWSEVVNADADSEVRAAAKAALQQIPVGKAKLRRVDKAERQVVAGTNIRLILHLSNGRRWEATVWHKLDGSFEVGKVIRVK